MNLTPAELDAKLTKPTLVPQSEGEQLRLIGENQACDKQQFHRIRKQLSGGATLTWEDGMLV